MRKLFNVWPVILILLPLSLVFDLSGAGAWWQAQVLTTATPGLTMASAVRWQLNQSLTIIRLLPQAAKQVIFLQNELAQAKSVQTQLKNLEEENQVLRQKLAMPAAAQPKLLLTTVISYPDPLIQLPADNNQLTGGVVLGQGAILGFIRNTTTKYGVVEVLASRSGRQLLVKTSAGVQGVVSYDGKNLVMAAVERQAKVEPGETVMSVGQPGVPPNLVVGSIGQVVSELTAPTQTLTVIQPTTLYQERVVEILKP